MFSSGRKKKTSEKRLAGTKSFLTKQDGACIIIPLLHGSVDRHREKKKDGMKKG
jgi:hypothetical protein